MTDAEKNFIICIKGLEKFNFEYIQANKKVLESRSLTQIQSTSAVASSGSMLTTSTTTTIIINDYIRMCRMYCIMLWTYWEPLKLYSNTLEELKLVRHCIVHHEGDISRYSQSTNTDWAKQGNDLERITIGKQYAQSYNLMIGENDLIYFTNLVKNEFTAKTKIGF